MFDLANFKMSHMIECSAALRQLSSGAQNMEEVANRVAGYLYDNFLDPQSQQRTCALVRFYKTHPYGELDEDLRGFAGSLLGDHSAEPSLKCLTMLATYGEKPEWNSRKDSTGHKAIPLPSVEAVKQIPMIAQLIKQFGLEVGQIVKPDPTLVVELEQKTYNVFHVEEALGSPFVPAQEQFVIPFGIRSVLGFGGLLPSGDLFAIIMFTKVHIPREATDLFKTFALSVKMALLPFVAGTVFVK
ncbi:MAG: hypothetical protein HYU64_03240 [Armatimonadetes bacterium]|nr:hypothetical protein [Armatimonadota bacterium]